MRIAILSDWCTASPFFEHALQVVEQLTKHGHELCIIAPKATEENILLAYQDGERVFRFEEATTAEQILAQLQVWEATALFVNGECDQNKARLNHVVKSFTGNANRSYLFVHEELFDKSTDYGRYSALIYPNSAFKKMPPGQLRIVHIDQGIPEFPDMADRAEFRKQASLPLITEPPKVEGELQPADWGYLLVTIASTCAGRTNIERAMQAVDYINRYNLVNRPVCLFVHSANPSVIAELDRKIDSDFIMFSSGYLSADTLAPYFQAADGALFIYPSSGKQNAPLRTSSAIRFAVGCKVPVITNKGEHSVDISSLVTSWATNDSVEAIKHAIVSLLANYELRRGTAGRVSKVAIEQMGWSVIGDQLDRLVTNKPLKVFQKT